VLLVGRLEQDPQPRSDSKDADCLLLLAVKRRPPGGSIEPGVAYLEVTVPWPRARNCADLRKGELIAVSGLIERNEWREEGQWRVEYEIVADWLELLSRPAKKSDGGADPP
jgi:single-stranded DNA-binding protein